MAEHIERKAAMTVPVLPKEYRTYQTSNLDDAYEAGWNDALENLKNIPAEDVLPVVRCKDCAKRRTGECPMDQGYPWLMSDSDDFCSSGVRIGVGDNGEDGKQAQEAVCGRWKRHGWHGGECECPVCGSLWDRMENKTEHFNFCPCCGARMRRELAHGNNVQCCGCKHQFWDGCELDLFVTKGGSHWANHTCKDREVESSEAGETEEPSET